MRSLFWCALAMSLSACAVTHRDFEPTERAHAQSPDGRPAAEYELGHEGVRWGEVRVWSDGITMFRDEEPPIASLHVGFEVENALDVPLQLDPAGTRVEDVDLGERTWEVLEADGEGGTWETPAGAVRRFDLEFQLPEHDALRHVRGFRVRWNLLGPDDWGYEQHTGFQLLRRRYRHWWPGPLFIGWHWGPSWCW